MSRTSIAPFALLALGPISPPATGQDPPKTPPKAKKPPTFVFEEEEGRAIKGVEVAPDPGRVAEVKEYPVNFEGPTAMGVTVFVTKVVLYSDGRCRWFFSFWNRSKESQTIFFDFEESFLADADSNPFPQLGRQIGKNRSSSFMTTITSDRRLNTWLDFKAPDQPTTKFKVGIMLEGRYDHRADAFRPFVVELTGPLPPAPKKPRTPEGRQDDGPAFARPERFEGERPGGMTREVGPPEGADTPVEPSHAASEAVRASSIEGHKYAGNIRSAEGVNGPGGIQFERRSDTRLVAATIYEKAQPHKDIRLIGDFYPQRSAPGGLIIRFEDFRKVSYTFVIDKNSMSGKDSEGNAYSFLRVKE